MAKTIGILTSGGDAPGMNAAIRAIVRAGIKAGFDVYGIKRGYKGLIENDMELMTVGSVADIIHRGGTILKTARCSEFATEQGLYKAIESISARNIDALVVIGGDGTLKGAKALVEKGIVCHHIPATIDNDLGYTDYTIGFDSAVNTVLSAINNIRDTGMAHDKTTVIEVMGRDCGDIALRAGVAGGADAILIPEMDMDVDEMCSIICAGMERKKKHHIIVRAEGANITLDMIEEAVKRRTGEETRKVILGYLQRGGAPTALDRMISTLMGVRVIELINDDENSKAVAYAENRVIEIDVQKAVDIKRQPDLELMEIAKALV